MPKPRDSSEIYQSVEQASNSVIVRSTMYPRPMIDRVGHNLSSGSDDQCRQKPMHVIEVRHGKEDAAVEHLDAATTIRRVIVKNPAPDSIRKFRTEQTPPGVPSLLPETGDQAALFGES